MSNDLDDLVNEVATRSKNRLDGILHEMAVNAGWPSEAVSAIHVIIKDKDLDVSIDDAYIDEVNALEYGSRRNSPSAVIRKFKYNLPKLVEDTVRQVISERVEGMVETI